MQYWAEFWGLYASYRYAWFWSMKHKQQTDFYWFLKGHTHYAKYIIYYASYGKNAIEYAAAASLC